MKTQKITFSEKRTQLLDMINISYKIVEGTNFNGKMISVKSNIEGSLISFLIKKSIELNFQL